MVNKNNKQTVIEICADYIYFVIIGKKNNLENFMKKLKEHEPDTKKKFIITRLDIPILFSYDNIIKDYENIKLIDNGTESAQSYAFAQEQFIFPKQNKKFINEDNTNYYMLMLIDDNILRYPKIDLIDEDPEQVIYEWIIKYYGSIPDKIKKSIKPLSLVGFNNEILVYTAKI